MYTINVDKIRRDIASFGSCPKVYVTIFRVKKYNNKVDTCNGLIERVALISEILLFHCIVVGAIVYGLR